MPRRLAVYLLAGLAALGIGTAAILAIGSGQEASGPEAPVEDGCDVVVDAGEQIEAVVAELTRGQVACLREGVHEADEVTVSAPRVTLTSFPGDRATLRGRLWVREGADGVTVENLDLDGRNDRDLPSPTVNAHETVWRDNSITNRHEGGSCMNLGSNMYGHADRTVIEANKIFDCGRLPPTNQHHGIYVTQSSETVIRRNSIYSNADRGIQLYPNADRTLVTGNVIDGNGQGMNFACDDDDCSKGNVAVGNLITNSVVSWNVYGHSQGADPDGSNLLRGNCVWATSSEYDDNGGIDSDRDFFSEEGNLIAEPAYADREAGDFELPEADPCRSLEVR